MEKGSKGPFVNIVLCFLAAWYTGFYQDKSDIKLDDEYGDTGTEIMTDFQNAHDLKPDGGFGPETRAKFEAVFGIKMDDLAKLCAYQNSTLFVQPEGAEDPELLWSCQTSSGSGH